MAGVTADGFVTKTQEELEDELDAEMRTNIAADLDLSAAQPLGQIKAIIAKKLAELWELAQAVYNSANPGAAEGVQLENVAAITGTTREPATKSRVTATVTLASAFTTLPAGSIANVAGQITNRWVSVADRLGTGDVVFESETPGPHVANAGTLTEITAPVAGWTAITNATDATLGTDVETDTALRVRREAELDAQGSGTVDTIRDALVRDVDGVISAHVFENPFPIKVDGLQPHSLKAVIYDGASPTADDDEVAQLLWNKKPGGIRYTGDTSGTATDSEGNPHTIPFSRATVKDVYFEYVLDVDPLLYPSDGDDQVKAAAVSLGASILKLGVDVVASRFKAAAFSVAGVIDVTAFTLGFSASPVGTANLAIGSGEIAALDTSRITVTS